MVPPSAQEIMRGVGGAGIMIRGQIRLTGGISWIILIVTCLAMRSILSGRSDPALDIILRLLSL